MSRFALKTLLADRNKLLIALTGVVFSLVLVNVQGGLFVGMIRKATILIDNSQADIWVGHRGMKNADIAAEIPESWLSRLRGIPGVRLAEPYIVAGAMMHLPNGDFEQLLIVGSDPFSMLGSAWSFAQGSLSDLRAPDAITIDALDAQRLGNPQLGDVVEINEQRARMVAKTNGIVGFITTPYVFTDLDSARQYARMREGYCSYFLIQAEPGENVESLCAQIRQQVPGLDVLTAQEFSLKTRLYWIARTGLGMSFGGSTLLGLTVGLAMVAQSLYAFVLDHKTDYATLKAIGADDRQVYGILVTQSLIIALIGTGVGTALSLLIRFVASTPRLTIATHPVLLAAAAVLAVGICLLSSILPFRRIRDVDPISVLQE